MSIVVVIIILHDHHHHQEHWLLKNAIKTSPRNLTFRACVSSSLLSHSSSHVPWESLECEEWGCIEEEWMFALEEWMFSLGEWKFVLRGMKVYVEKSASVYWRNDVSILKNASVLLEECKFVWEEWVACIQRNEWMILIKKFHILRFESEFGKEWITNVLRPKKVYDSKLSRDDITRSIITIITHHHNHHHYVCQLVKGPYSSCPQKTWSIHMTHALEDNDDNDDYGDNNDD